MGYSRKRVEMNEFKKTNDIREKAQKYCAGDKKAYIFGSTIGSGAYGQVVIAKQINKADHNSTPINVAVKYVPHEKMDCLSHASIREITSNLELGNNNYTVGLNDLIALPNGIGMVFDLMEGGSLSDIIYGDDKSPLPASTIQKIMRELLTSLEYVHDKNILHRDIKPQNILIDSNGRCRLADFGLAKKFCPNFDEIYESGVVTQWYRAPELLLGSNHYNEKIDMWSIGCMMAELYTRFPFFHQHLWTDEEQLRVIYEKRGNPRVSDYNECQFNPVLGRLSIRIGIKTKISALLEGIDSYAADLIEQLLSYDPNKRPSAADALLHPYFYQVYS